MVEITDEMVERALSEFSHSWRSEGCINENRTWLRNVLDKALNPPPVPEIPVTEEMVQAGTPKTEQVFCRVTGGGVGGTSTTTAACGGTGGAGSGPAWKITPNTRSGKERRTDRMNDATMMWFSSQSRDRRMPSKPVDRRKS